MRRRQKQVEAAEWDLAAILGRAPTEVETAAKLGMDVERYRRMMFDLRNGGPVSASTHVGVDLDLPLPDFPSKTDTHPDSIFAREQLGRVQATIPFGITRITRLCWNRPRIRSPRQPAADGIGSTHDDGERQRLGRLIASRRVSPGNTLRTQNLTR
jgi:hypothetical protein